MVLFRFWLQRLLHIHILILLGDVMSTFINRRGMLHRRFLNLLGGVKNILGRLDSSRCVKLSMRGHILRLLTYSLLLDFLQLADKVSKGSLRMPTCCESGLFALLRVLNLQHLLFAL